MTVSFEVQARLIERRGGGVARDETRLASATRLDDAVTEARRHVADGFTVWIFRVESGSRLQRTYSLLDTLHPTVPSRSSTGSVSGAVRSWKP